MLAAHLFEDSRRLLAWARAMAKACSTLLILMLGAIMLLCPSPAWSDDWRNFTSNEYNFSVRVPSNVTQKKDVDAIGFISKAAGTTYMVLVLPKTSEPNASWSKWSSILMDNQETAEDVSGKGWQGKIFSGTKDGNKVYGAFVPGRVHYFAAVVTGTSDQEDRDRFIDSLVISGGDAQAGDQSNTDNNNTQAPSTSDSSSSNHSISQDSQTANSQDQNSPDAASSSDSSGGWKEFESKKYYFKVLMPGSVEKMRNPEVHEAPLFRSVYDGCAYVVSVLPNSDHSFDKRWSDYQATSPNISDVKDISGSGWTGKSYITHKDGKSLPSMMAGAKDGFFYVLEVSSAQGSVDKFFNSFSTTPADPMAEDRIAYDDLKTDWKEKSKTTGFIVGATVVGLFLFFIAAGVIVLTVILIKRNNKQPKM